MERLRGAAVGAGYFSAFHLDAWGRLPDVEIVAVCDRDPVKAAAARDQFQIARSYDDPAMMLDAERPDFLDIITPPESHLELVRLAAERGIAVICQKPLAPTLAEARAMVEAARSADVRLMVHENFRFQPWHREIKRLLDAGTIGARLHSLNFRTRTGDGWGENAYLDRQPYFRAMPRFLVRETGIHFIDTFRFLGGEVERVFARLKRLNPSIAGEDRALVLLEFRGGALGVWDANRYNEPDADDPRYTLGEFLVEADGGSIRLGQDGSLTIQPLGERAREHRYEHPRIGFGGDCVRATQRHFLDQLRSGRPFETEASVYLRNLVIEEALYESARLGAMVAVPSEE